MFKSVIFDMDGVLVDSHPVHERAWRRMMESLGRSVSAEDLAFLQDGRKREDILRFFLGDLSPEELRHYGSMKDQLFTECAADMQLVEGVREFLIALTEAGMQLAVASSASQVRVERILDRFELRQYFGAVVTGDDVVLGKPDPAVFQLACQRLHGVPALSLVVEDAAAGVRGARAAGMLCLGIADENNAHRLYAAGAGYVAPNFTGLRPSAVFQAVAGAEQPLGASGPAEPPSASVSSW